MVDYGSGSLSAPMDFMENNTGHLIGMLSRIHFCFDNNINTIWVFDGQPPEEKWAELNRRR